MKEGKMCRLVMSSLAVVGNLVPRQGVVESKERVPYAS